MTEVNKEFQPKHLGIKVGQFSDPDKNILDTFPNPGITVVRFETAEMTSLCPKTGQPDWESVVIQYRPSEKCLESKSLKLYLQSFRNHAAFMEELAVRIWNDISDAIEPLGLSVDVTCTPRGGIALTAHKEGIKILGKADPEECV